MKSTNLLITIVTLMIVATASLFAVVNQETHTRIYPAKVVEKMLIAPTDIPYELTGFDEKDQPVYKPGETKTAHAFVVVSTGRCTVIPVDREYFYAVDENTMIPVAQKTAKITGVIVDEQVHYDFGIPQTNN